jgi:hypothetical protein
MSERLCACGCGLRFVPRTGNHRFFNPEHRERSKWATRRFDKSAKYGAEHRKLRARLAREIAAQGAVCVRCGDAIVAGEPWDLDHRDDGAGYLGPAHRTCNRSAGGEASHRRNRAPEAGVDDPERGVFWRHDPQHGWQRVSRRW